MTVGSVTVFWLLPIALVCGSIGGVQRFGVARCLKSLAAAIYAAACGYESFKAEWVDKYRSIMDESVEVEA